MAEPWERIIAVSLGSHAAAPCRWSGSGSLTPIPLGLPTTYSAESVLLGTGGLGPSAPASTTRRRVEPMPYIGMRHVIGRAVATSAGPAMDVTGETITQTSSALSSPRQLLVGVTELKLERASPS